MRFCKLHEVTVNPQHSLRAARPLEVTKLGESIARSYSLKGVRPMVSRSVNAPHGSTHRGHEVCVRGLGILPIMRLLHLS